MRVNNFRLYLLSLAVVFGAGLMFNTRLSAEEPIPQVKLDAIRTLMQITGAQSTSEQFSTAFTQQFISVLRANNSVLSDKAITIVTEEIAKVVAEELENENLQLQIFPIYARYFTLEELEGLIEFNQSATGIKANKVMPMLLRESMNVAQAWSQAVGPKISERIFKRFKEEGINIQPSSN